MKLPENVVKKSLQNPMSVFNFIKYRTYYNLYLTLRSVNQWYFSKFTEPSGLDIHKQDWTVLIILDACRFDLFKQLNNIEGELSREESPGSMSEEFIDYNFVGHDLQDTVYITANPFAIKIPEGTFHDMEIIGDDEGDGESGTVPPDIMRQKTEMAIEQYPHKRIISHFMQPHHPFLSSLGEEVDEDLHWEGNQYFLSDMSDESLQRAYKENLQIALSEVQTLISNTSVELAITSDHGELLGERLYPIPIKGYEHPKSLYTTSLVNVPWLHVSGDSREIEQEPPVQEQSYDHNQVKNRLRQMGYL